MLRHATQSEVVAACYCFSCFLVGFLVLLALAQSVLHSHGFFCLATASSLFAMTWDLLFLAGIAADTASSLL